MAESVAESVTESKKPTVGNRVLVAVLVPPAILVIAFVMAALVPIVFVYAMTGDWNLNEEKSDE